MEVSKGVTKEVTTMEIETESHEGINSKMGTGMVMEKETGMTMQREMLQGS